MLIQSYEIMEAEPKLIERFFFFKHCVVDYYNASEER